MIYLLIGLTGVTIFLDLASFFLFRPSAPVGKPEESYPRVAVLVAARNEAGTIGNCLEALLAQDYDMNNVEILVGDDQSTDTTSAVVQKYSSVNENIYCYPVPENYASLSGKAKVLAWLARKTDAEVLLIMDADTVPGKQWINAMAVELVGNNCDLVNGLTSLKGSYFQDMEWVYAQGMLKILGDIWRPVTGIGNNMGFTRQAYEALGGYEKIPFSLTEDHALCEAAYLSGFRHKQLFSPQVRAVSFAEEMPWPYLKQRKRWMTGAFKIPVNIRILLVIQSLFLVLTGFLLIIVPVYGVAILVARMVIRGILFMKFYKGAGKKMNPLNECWFELFSGIMNLVAIIYFIVPGRVEWKGRKYKMRPA